jgi:hypothetical protein
MHWEPAANKAQQGPDAKQSDDHDQDDAGDTLDRRWEKPENRVAGPPDEPDNQAEDEQVEQECEQAR